MPSICITGFLNDECDSTFVGKFRSNDDSKLVISNDSTDGVECVIKVLPSCDDGVYEITDYVGRHIDTPKILHYTHVCDDVKTGVSKFINNLIGGSMNHDYLSVGAGVLILERIEGRELSANDLADPSIIQKLCSSIEKLHEIGIIHGDIHESNFIVTKNKEVYLVNFDLSFDIDYINNPNVKWKPRAELIGDVVANGKDKRLKPASDLESLIWLIARMSAQDKEKFLFEFFQNKIC